MNTINNNEDLRSICKICGHVRSLHLNLVSDFEDQPNKKIFKKMKDKKCKANNCFCGEFISKKI